MTDDTRAHTEEPDDPRASTDEDARRGDGENSNSRGGGGSSPRAAADEAYVCTDCDERWFYARARCPDCGGGDHATYELGVGRLRATTTSVVTPPDVRDENPLGLAEFDGGVTVLAQLPTGEARPDVDDAVVLTGSVRLRDGVRGARLHAVGEDTDAGDAGGDDAAPRGGGTRLREVREP